MRLTKLLRSPQATIAQLLNTNSDRWPVPFVAYVSQFFADAHCPVIELLPTWNPFVVMLLAAIVAVLIGGWLWAAACGGLLHLVARVLHGQPGAARTIKAVGYGLFWPAVTAALFGTGATLLGGCGGYFEAASSVPLALHISANLWGVYTATAAVRVRHLFSWWRAISVYLVLFVSLLVVSFVATFLWHMLRAS